MAKLNREAVNLLSRAATVAHLIEKTIETNEEFTSTDFLDLEVAAADLQQLIREAHQAQYGL